MKHNEFPPERIAAIRSALVENLYRQRPLFNGEVTQFWRNGADGVMVPTPECAGKYADTSRRAAEAIESLIRYHKEVLKTGNQFLELGPLTEREEAYARLSRSEPIR